MLFRSLPVIGRAISFCKTFLALINHKTVNSRTDPLAPRVRTGSKASATQGGGCRDDKLDFQVQEFAVDPSSYLKIKLAEGVALGVVIKTDLHGAHSVSLQVGGGIGEEVIYKPPVNIGLNYNIP
jgi:hypothetical protein